MLANLKMPKAPVRMIEPLTTEEIDKLISVQNPLTSMGSLNIAILITFLGTGVRESELSSLSFEDAHIEQGYLKVMGKGSKERVLPIGGLGQKLLWRYVFHFRPEPINELNNYLFLTIDGKKLEPFKAFLNVPCEICHELITEWGDYSVKLAIQGIGFGHTHCWSSEIGRMREFRKAIEKFKKDTNRDLRLPQ